MKDQHDAHSLRVFVAGWVIQDGSFPKAAVGDIVDVSLEHYSPDKSPTAYDETRTAIARPVYGRAPRKLPSSNTLTWLHLVYGDGWSSTWWSDRRIDGTVTLSGVFAATLEDGSAYDRPVYGRAPRKLPSSNTLTWLHLVYGDGWSSTWWSDRRIDGTVTLSGVFAATLEDGSAYDRPPRTYGRVTRIQSVESQFRREENGWRSIPGTDRLTDWAGPAAPVEWWPHESTKDGDFVPTGLLVELDFDGIADCRPDFCGGAMSIADDILWVVDRREPIVRRVDMSVTPADVTEYVLPLAFELDNGMWSRRIHAYDGGFWLTSEYDIHRCTIMDNGDLNIDRYATEGGKTTTLYNGKVYIIGQSRSHMSSDRRHGAVRSAVDVHALQVLDESTRSLVPVGDSELLRVVAASTRPAHRIVADDGRVWRFSGANQVCRTSKIDNVTERIELHPNSRAGVVHWTTPDPWTDPANADEVARITVDMSFLRKSAE